MVAKAISGTLKESDIDVGTCCVKGVNKLSTKEHDSLGLGSPTKFGTISFAI